MKKTGSLNISHPYNEGLDIPVSTISTGLTNFEKVCQDENSKEPAWKCRYVVTLIGFLVNLSTSIHRTVMSVVIVAMVNNTAIIQTSKVKSESCPDLIANSTDDATLHLFTEGEFIWSSETQGHILGCFFIGSVFSLIPAGRLAERFGCKWIIVGALITLSLLTILIPPFSRFSASAVIVIQTLRGFAQGIPGTCTSILMANWCPKTERGFLFSIIVTSHSLGPALGDIFAGYISQLPGGWSYAFYIVGVSGLALAGYIFFFIAENPKEHPSITKAELNFILSQQESKLSRRRPKLPWRQMLTSIPLYALIIAVFGRYWKFSQFWIVHSTFLGTILHYPIGQNGLFSAIPFLLSFLISSIASWISGYIEKRKAVSTDFLRKFWIFTSSVLYSLCLLGTYITGCNKDLSVIFSILSMGLSGVGTPGYVIVVQDMSPTFSGTLYSIASTFGYMASVILPLMIGYLTDGMQTLEQWNKVFFVSIGIVMSSAIIFLIFGSAEIQSWNFVDEEDKKEDERKPDNNEKVEALFRLKFNGNYKMKKTVSLNISHPCKEGLDVTVSTILTGLTNFEKVCQNENSKEPAWKCRYVVTLIGFLVNLSTSIHRTLMSVVIVAMVNNTATIQVSKAKSESCPGLIANSTDNSTLHRFRTEGEFIWSPETQGHILGCFFIGSVFSLIPAGRLAERFGCKWIVAGSLIALSLLTISIPPFSRLSASAVIVIQTLRGFAQGMSAPCISILMANWCPKTERGFLFSIIITSHSLGPALGDIFAGYISELPGGWSYAFYIVGVSGLALAGYIVFFIAENPKEHPRITKAELNVILSQQESKLSRKRPKLPWRQMLTSIPLYALIIVIFGRYWNYSQFLTVHSTFLGTILHYPIGQNGLFSAIPFLLSFLISSITNWISGYIEKKKAVSTDFLRKFWIFTSSVLYSLCLLGTYLAGCNKDMSVIFSILSMGLSGVGTPGYMVLVQDMSPTFSGTLYSIASTSFGYIASVILPLMVGYLTDGMQTLEQWNKVFFISIGVVMSSAIIFIIFGSAEIQPWNFVEEEDKKKDERKPDNNEKVEETRY